VTETRLPPPQLPLKNTRKLYIRLPDAKKSLTIAVLFTPGDEAQRQPRLAPLNKWRQRDAIEQDR
jgi:hypothetical protein